MPQTIITCTLIVAIVLYYAISKHIEYARLNNLTSLIAWCVTEDSRIHRDNLDLIDYVQNAQNRYISDNSLKITSDEEIDIAKKILKAFQIDTTQDFFRNPNMYRIPKSKYVLQGETYFMFLLQEYLARHQCDSFFIEQKMHKKTIEYESYGNFSFDAVYELSDFGIVLHKLLYISCRFCRNSVVLNPKGEDWYSEQSIENNISSKTISLSRF